MSQVIGEGSVALFHYTLRGDDGAVIDTSDGRGAMAYLHGHGNIVPGLEAAMVGKVAGDAFDVAVAPADGYGEFDASAVQQVHRSQLPAGFEPQVGMPLQAQGPDGHGFVVFVHAVEGAYVSLTTNHPLAGQTLHFAIRIEEVREASAEELEHGHVHGAGGHHH
ncbi:MAG: hypothetical protein RLZZ383_1033 [Pseudomonadota bacterium]|jgi:FKBP-type peptidyl-prolyl cis-trans isomerase SlyD